MLGQIEIGESSPTIATLWKIASGFETSFSSFIEDADLNQEQPIYLTGNLQHLNEFLFRSNSEINTRVASLSGGEKARLSLCLISAKTPALLILDEIKVYHSHRKAKFDSLEHLVKTTIKRFIKTELGKSPIVEVNIETMPR